MKLNVDQLWMNKEDDYLALLPVYVLPDEEEQKNLYPAMDEIIEKCSTVIDRHSMDIKKKEHNKWIDENFLMLGIANYYKGKYATAQEMFSYCAKKYKGQASRFDAALWLARTYVEQERYAKATTVLSVIENDNSKDRPKDFQAGLATVYADLYLRQNRFKEALPHVEDAALLTKEKREKARLTYILAQTYQELNRSRDAIDAYIEVVELRPDYEMEFYAKISQALAFDRRLDSKKIKDMLWAMAKEEKNEEYYDQIYYALAEIALEEQEIEKAIELLQASANKSVSNPRQKGKSYLRLAELYFVDREYVLAKNYYDSTATYLPEDYPEYVSIVAKGASLTDLVEDLNTVAYNDSIIALASLSDKEKEKKIIRIIADLEAEAEQKKQDELDALQRLQNQASVAASKSRGNSKTWYFYNSGTLGSGFQEFQRRWGSRKLEDNWRRSNKSDFSQIADNFGPDGDTIPSNLGQTVGADIKSVEEYLAELPNSSEELAAAHNEIITALYDIGTLYKERLKDDDNAIESFVRITNDYDTSATAPQALYQLYRIYLEKEQSGGFVGTGFKDNSEYYKNVLLADFPDSEFSKLILDPAFITERNQRYENEKALYEETYKKYNRRQYTDVLITCNTVIQEEPNNNFLSKYYLVKALTVGARKDADAYETLLRDIITKFKGTPEADKAAELLGELNDAKARLAREQNKPDANDISQAGTDSTTTTAPAPVVNTSMYAEDENGEHFFALVFPKTDGDATEIKETIADFNSASFRNSNLRITNSFIDKDHQIIIVRSFDNKSAAMEYYNAFYGNTSVLAELNAKTYDKFVISTKNFTTLFRNKNKEEYKAFFSLSYLK